MSTDRAKGSLSQRWSASVDDYAIAGSWAKEKGALVVCDVAGSVYAFDGKSGDRLWTHQSAHEGGLLMMAMHPSGKVFATSGQDGRVLLWRVSDGKVEHVIEVGQGWVESLAWSPRGQRLAVACGRQVHVYKPDGEEVWHTDDHPSTVSTIGWSGGRELATACYGRVAFFDAMTGELRQKLEWKGSLVSMVLSPDGDVVACGSQDNTVHFWRRSTEEDSMMAGYSGKPSALSFDASGTLLATGGGRSVTVWSFKDGGPEGTSPGVLDLHTDAVKKLVFAPRRLRLASGSRDGSVVVWSLASDGAGDAEGIALLPGAVAELCWQRDGRALAGLDAQGGVTVWDVAA
ncbi:MAG: PQQ-binding-like beta-propeller repeat protein [Pseudomonadota bacterium]